MRKPSGRASDELVACTRVYGKYENIRTAVHVACINCEGKINLCQRVSWNNPSVNFVDNPAELLRNSPQGGLEDKKYVDMPPEMLRISPQGSRLSQASPVQGEVSA